FTQLFFVDHAVGFAQEQGGETMAVHRPVQTAVEDSVVVVNVPLGLGLDLFEDVVHGFGYDLTVFAPAGLVAARHEGQATQAGNGQVALVVGGAEGAVGVLVAGQGGKALVDGLLGRRGNHPLGGAAVGHFVIGDGEE